MPPDKVADLCKVSKNNSLMKFLYALAFLMVSTFGLSAQEREKPMEPWEQAEAEADRLQSALDLEDWQVFYVDSTLKHDYAALMAEAEKLQASKGQPIEVSIVLKR